MVGIGCHWYWFDPHATASLPRACLLPRINAAAAVGGGGGLLLDVDDVGGEDVTSVAAAGCYAADVDAGAAARAAPRP